MQFQVPQFIDLAPRIVGPLTIRQLLYLAGAGVPSFGLFFVLSLWLWVIITTVLAAIAAALAFGKINGQSLPHVALAAFRYFWHPRFYLWQREAAPPPHLPTLPKLPPTPTQTREKLNDQALKSLSLKITTTANPIEKRERPTFFFLADLFHSSRDRFETFRRTTGDREAARRVDYR